MPTNPPVKGSRVISSPFLSLWLFPYLHWRFLSATAPDDASVSSQRTQLAPRVRRRQRRDSVQGDNLVAPRLAENQPNVMAGHARLGGNRQNDRLISGTTHGRLRHPELQSFAIPSATRAGHASVNAHCHPQRHRWPISPQSLPALPSAV